MRSRRRIAFRMTAFCDPWAGRRPWAAVARIRRIFATAPAALPAGPRPATGGRSSTRQGIARRCRDRAEAARGVSRRHPLRTAARRGGATEPRRSPVLSPRPGGPRAGSPGLLREPARRLARRRPAAPCVRDDRRAVHGGRARRRSGACRGCRPDPPPGRASRGRAPRGKGRADGRHVLSVRLRPGRGERPPTLSPESVDAHAPRCPRMNLGHDPCDGYAAGGAAIHDGDADREALSQNSGLLRDAPFPRRCPAARNILAVPRAEKRVMRAIRMRIPAVWRSGFPAAMRSLKASRQRIRCPAVVRLQAVRGAAPTRLRARSAGRCLRNARPVRFAAPGVPSRARAAGRSAVRARPFLRTGTIGMAWPSVPLKQAGMHCRAADGGMAAWRHGGMAATCAAGVIGGHRAGLPVFRGSGRTTQAGAGRPPCPRSAARAARRAPRSRGSTGWRHRG